MLLNIFILSAVIERTWEHLQQVIGEEFLSTKVKLIGSGLLSVAAATTLRLDLLYALEVTGMVSSAGMVLTGIAIGLGSNLIHDLVGIVNGLSGRARTNPDCGREG